MIANALDEASLTGTRNPRVSCDERGAWHIRDWGRGLRYEHLTLNENEEKLHHADKVVGKFGVGLKDALATFDRREVEVRIRSRHAVITTDKAPKHGFSDVTTLHAIVGPPEDPVFVGTDVELMGVSQEDVAEARKLFLRYAGDQEIEKTRFGQVLRRLPRQPARIYVNGLRVAEESNYLFSYNITSPTKVLREALNRERSHVGRTAYSRRVQDILLACEGEMVANALVADLEQYETGGRHDELEWPEVRFRAIGVLNARQDVVFVSARELDTERALVDRVKQDGKRVVVLPQADRAALPNLKDVEGNPVRDLSRFARDWGQSIEYAALPIEELTNAEREVWGCLNAVFALAGGRPSHVKDVIVSKSIRPRRYGFTEVVGLWVRENGLIVVKRSELGSTARFASTVLHELGHARSGADHGSINFEDELSNLLGLVASNGLGRDGPTGSDRGEAAL